MKMMKKVLVLLAVMTPVLLMAQSKKVPTNRATNSQKVAPFVMYEYVTMFVSKAEAKAPAVQPPKKGKKTKAPAATPKGRQKVVVSFDFGKEKKSKEASKFDAQAGSFKNTIDALNFLGARGWELVAKEGDTYLLKRARK